MSAIDAFALADTVALPAPPAGWFDYRCHVLIDGRLALARTRADYGDWSRRRRQAWQAGETISDEPMLGERGLRLSIFDGVRETDATEVTIDFFPMVERMADGRWILTHPRAWKGEANAFIHAASGVQEASLHLGDGISHLLCAPDGSIWVGYFDEGVYAAADEAGRAPVSTGGIVQFDGSGAPRWSLADAASAPPVDDCYALSLNGGTPWACYYSDFPIVRIADGSPTVWINGGVSGAKALAFADDIILLAGGYGDMADRLAVARLEGRHAGHYGDLQLPEADSFGMSLLQGRDGVMHIVRNGVWAKIDPQRAFAALPPLT